VGRFTEIERFDGSAVLIILDKKGVSKKEFDSLEQLGHYKNKNGIKSQIIHHHRGGLKGVTNGYSHGKAPESLKQG